MGQPASRGYMCCSVRDKYGQQDVMPEGITTPRFQCTEIDLELEKPKFVSFAPVFQRQEVPLVRRVAVASTKEVHVYRVPDTELLPGEQQSSPNSFPMVHALKVEGKQVITSVLFCDEDASRQLAVAFAPDGNVKGDHCVRVWNCDAKEAWLVGEEPPKLIPWKYSDGYLTSLDDHTAPITCLATNRTYFVTADKIGECRVWQKGRAFARRATHTLHSSGVTDLAVDRLFAYSAGHEDRRICVWSLPALSPVVVIPMEIPEGLLTWVPVTNNGTSELNVPSSRASQAETVVGAGVAVPAAAALADLNPGAGTGRSAGGSGRLVRLSFLRRPLSRWAGWQGSTRGPKAPRGWLFVAGVLGGDGASASSGQGVLMEWSLGEKPVCQSAQVVHDSPLAALAYGPYDNGPLITADARGIFRVWELQLGKGLRFSQQIELLWLAPGQGELQIAVEQPRGLYAVSTGGRRLFVWQRHHDGMSRF